LTRCVDLILLSSLTFQVVFRIWFLWFIKMPRWADCILSGGMSKARAACPAFTGLFGQSASADAFCMDDGASPVSGDGQFHVVPGGFAGFVFGWADAADGEIQAHGEVAGGVGFAGTRADFELSLFLFPAQNAQFPGR
jgi:hypothetical protein